MTDSFISQREKQQKKKFFRDKANKKVRMNNFLKAMKTQYGPNVEMFGEDAIRVDKDDSQTVVGNYSDFLESGGQLQGSPVTAEDLKIKKKKPKIEKAVVKDENSEAFGRMEDVLGPNPNQKLYDFADEVNTNRRELNIADMEQYSNNQMEMYDLPPSSNPNTNVSEMAFRGTDSASFDAVRSKIAKDPSRIQKGLMESGFTADRLANLVIANKTFQANKRKKR
tara:strand:+ start:148 stop:819 length:672 start_codon:yes stop_codon:yes gene_type:complete